MPSWRGLFHRCIVKRVVPRGDVPRTEPGNGHRTNLSTSYPLAGRPGHLDHGFRPCSFTFCLHHPPSVSGGIFTALWDANSTAVCWACQEGSPIYCISVLTLGMPVWSQSFSTSEFSRFKPAFQDARKACVSFGLQVRRIVEASWQASAPWAHRYPRRFRGGQPDKSRRTTQPNSRRRGRCVGGRVRPRT